MQIPEKIKKGQDFVPETRRKINAIIDSLHAMQLTGVGPIGVDRLPDGSVVKLSQNLQIKEIVEQRSVQQVVYDGPWMLEIDGDRVALNPSPVVQINGYFHTYSLTPNPSYSPLSAVFAGAEEDESFRYAVLKSGLDMIHTGSYYFDVIYVKDLAKMPSTRQQCFFPLGEIWRWKENNVWQYDTTPYYVGIPAMKMVFSVDLNLDSPQNA